MPAWILILWTTLATMPIIMAGELKQYWGPTRPPITSKDFTVSVELPPGSAVEKLREKKQPSLGELNPLLYPPDFQDVSALIHVTQDKIDMRGGLQPVSIDTALVGKDQVPRLVARFEIDQLTSHQVGLLEALVQGMYEAKVRTRSEVNGSPARPTGYPQLVQKTSRGRGAKEAGKHLGWYMGPDTSPVNPEQMGLLVFRDLGDSGMAAYLRDKSPNEWFFKYDLVNPMGKPLKTKYIVEMREGVMYQTDVVEFMTQIGSVLGTDSLLPGDQLLYEIYNDLNRLGLKKTIGESLYGLDEQINRLDRTTILPLANLELSTGIEMKPSSSLLIGVPGTGKTAVVEKLLQEDTGIFILPIDPLQLARDLGAQPEKRRILPRIARVFGKTRRPVVIHLDDVENIATGDEQINSTLLNLMAGVRESGFFVIASTNYPERLSPQLLQPQRFANVIYFGLHDEEARVGILDIHATAVSRELEKPLFSSSERRETLIRAMAKLSEDYTPRFLAEICTEAKSFYLQRVSRLRQSKTGLSEKDLENITTDEEDWAAAWSEVEKKYDKKGTKDRDDALRRFAENYYRNYGFGHQNGTVAASQRLRSTMEQIAATYVPQQPS